MTIQTIATVEHGTATLRLSGDLDLDAQSRVDKAVMDVLVHRPRAIVVDMHDLAFIDCAGIGILIRGRQKAAQQGCSLIIGNAQGVVAYVLSRTNTLDWLSGPTVPDNSVARRAPTVQDPA